MKEIKVGFIGTGSIAKVHLERLIKIDGVKVKALHDTVKEKAEEVSQKFGGKVYTDHHEMLDKEALDALFICLPPFAHTDQEVIAARKGINLFIEKPVALTLEKAQEIEKAVKKSKVIVSVGYLRRYSTLTDKIKELLKDKKIALIQGYRGCPLVLTPWWKVKSLSGGQIVEMVTHTFDLMRFICGEVDKVHAFGYQGLRNDVKDYDIEDASTVNILFKSGTIGNISSNCLMKKAWESSLYFITRDMSLKLERGGLTISNGEEKVIKPENEDCMYVEDKIFIEAVKTGDTSKIRCDYSEGVKSLRLVLAANESIETGKIVKV